MAPPRSAPSPGSLRQPGSVPAPMPRDQPVRLLRTPRARLVRVNRGWGVQERLEDAPALLDAVLTGEPGALAGHRGVQQDLVGGGPLPSLLGELQVQVDSLRHRGVGTLRVEQDSDAGARVQLDHDLVRLGPTRPPWEEAEPRRMMEDDAQLGLGDRQLLAGADEDG